MSAGIVVLNIFLAALTQVLLWVGSTILVGFIIALGNKLFYKCTGTASFGVCVATGVLGVPLHETGHALFCLIFAHKITEIKFFQPKAPDGVLGYVKHSYNPKNIYQKAGNFFIGIGPILFISAIIFLLEFLLVPDMFKLSAAISAQISNSSGVSNISSPVWAGLLYLSNFFSVRFLTDWKWWIFVVLSCLMAMHMNLSKADIKGSISGLVFVICVFALIPIIVSFFDLKNLSVMFLVTNAMTTGAIFYVGFLTTAVVFVYIMVILAFIIGGIVRLIKKLHKSKNV